MRLSEEDIVFLDQYRNHYDQYVQLQIIKNFDHAARNRLLDIARKFDARYLADLNCNDCVADLMAYVYQGYLKELNEKKQPTGPKMTFPVIDPLPAVEAVVKPKKKLFGRFK